MTPHHKNVIHLKGGKLDGDTRPEDVDQLVAELENSAGPAGLVIHFHGGMVSKTDGLATADQLRPQYEAAGAFPIFFVWESALFETVRNNLVDISQETFFRQLTGRVMEFALRQLGALAGPLMREAPESGQRLPSQADVRDQINSWFDANEPASAPPFEGISMPATSVESARDMARSIHREIRDDHELNRSLQEIANDVLPADEVRTRSATAITARGSRQSLMTPEGLAKLVEYDAPGRRGILSAVKLTIAVTSVVYRVVRRHVRRRDHGLFVTVVEEVLRELYLGNVGKTFVWDQIKKDTRDAFGDDPNLHGGTALLTRLAGRAQHGWTIPRITLVGHSAGSVFICNFLEKADALLPRDVSFDVIFLAPAVNVRTFDHTLSHYGHRIRNFRMFTMSDRFEIQDPLHPSVRLIYPRSILYFLSGLLEDKIDEPILGMQRFLTGDAAFSSRPETARIMTWLRERPERVSWSIGNDGAGRRSEATSHIEFDNESYTIASVQHLLQHGFSAAARSPATQPNATLATRRLPADVKESTVETKYLDFKLEIGDGHDGEYPVTVIQSPAGQVQGTMRFPFERLALENWLLKLERAVQPQHRRRRRASRSDEDTVQQFGRQLFDALFIEPIRKLFYETCDLAGEGREVRLTLHIQAAQLAALPWEFLYDPREPDFVCLSRFRPLVRYLDRAEPIEPLRVTPPLRILGMISQPEQAEALDVETEKRHVEEALRELQEAQRVELTWVERATVRELQHHLRRGPWHVFHFIGHGEFDALTHEGQLVLEDDRGRPFRFGATDLGRLFRDHPSLRLVVLNACEGGRGSLDDVCSSVAAMLVRRGVPAAVGMQYEISDEAAKEFARSFYTAVADGDSVEAAVAEARKAIRFAMRDSLEWATPVLYLRASDGTLFEPLARPSSAVQAPAQKPSQDRVTQAPAARPDVPSQPTAEVKAPITASRPRIFISYRREDSADVTGRIHDRLVNRFGKEAIFMDVDSIGPGEDFPKFIADSVRRCQVMLVVIGRGWAEAKDENGGRRLDNSGDFVRLEVEAGLRSAFRVVPVLVQSTRMPRREKLPPSIQPIVEKNACEVRHNPDFHHDMEKLISVLERILADPQADVPATVPALPTEAQMQEQHWPSNTFGAESTDHKTQTLVRVPGVWYSRPAHDPDAPWEPVTRTPSTVQLDSNRVYRLEVFAESDEQLEGLAHLNELAGLQSLQLLGSELTDSCLAYLAGLTSLQSLYIANSCLTGSGLSHLKALTKLHTLTLECCYGVTDAGLAQLKGMTSLRVLTAHCNKLTDAALAHLKGLTSLYELDISGCDELTDSGLAHLKGLASLRKLKLTFCAGLTGEGLAHFRALTGLQELSLVGCNQLTDAGLVHLKPLKNLHTLELWACDGLTDAGLAHLIGLASLKVLSVGLKQLTVLGLKHVKGLGSLQELDVYCHDHSQNQPLLDGSLAHLKGLTCLRKLDFSHCDRLTGAGLAGLNGLTGLRELNFSYCERLTNAALAHLEGLTGLRELDFSGCKKLTDVGLAHVKGLTNLQRLNLFDTKLTDAGLAHLKGLFNLHELDLSFNTGFTDAGLFPFRGLTKLQRLRLCGCKQLTDSALVHLKGLTSLESLDLRNTQFTNTGLWHLTGLNRLSWLDLTQTRVTAAGVSNLLSAHPNCIVTQEPTIDGGRPNRPANEELLANEELEDIDDEIDEAENSILDHVNSIVQSHDADDFCFCPACGVNLKVKNLNRHVMRTHPPFSQGLDAGDSPVDEDEELDEIDEAENSILDQVISIVRSHDADDFCFCPACGVNLKVKNLNRHVMRTHPPFSQGLDSGDSEVDEVESCDEGDEWYVQKPDGQTFGPVSKAVLDVWVEENRVGREDLLLQAGCDEWQSATDCYPQLD